MHSLRAKAAVLVLVPLLPVQVSAELLGVAPGEPLFNYNSGGTTTFNAATGALVVNATPLDYTQIGGTPLTIFPLATAPQVNVRLSLDDACNLVGGDAGDDLSVSGDIDLEPQDFVPEYSGTLLTGEIVTLGIDSAAIPLTLDARFAITGGALVAAGDYTLGAEVGVILTVENNNFAGSCLANWNGGAKGRIGAIEPVIPPVESCFDVKKIKIRDGKKHYRHWGYYGISKSKVKASLTVACEAGFDPEQSLISLALDGESFVFPVGSFTQVGDSDKYRALVTGSPRMSATLNCETGRFGFSASGADTSQINNADGVDVVLVLGDQTHTKNVMLQETGHQHWQKGQNNVSYYHNDDPLYCGVVAENDDTDMYEIKFRHKHSGRIYTFKRSKGGYGRNCIVNDLLSGHFASFDTSKQSTISCGSGDDNFEVVEIEHRYANKSCTLLSEEEEDDDLEDNQHD